MAKFKGDYYCIELDEREIGGELTTLHIIHDWKAACAAWDKQPEPEQGCVWFGRCNPSRPDDSDTIAYKGPDQPRMWLEWVKVMDELAREQNVRVRGNVIDMKATRH